MRVEQEWCLGVEAPVQNLEADHGCHPQKWPDHLTVFVLRVILAVVLIPLVAILAALTCLVAAIAATLAFAQRSGRRILEIPPLIPRLDTVPRWPEAVQGGVVDEDRELAAPSSGNVNVNRPLGPR
jgi:hypothetical protein